MSKRKAPLRGQLAPPLPCLLQFGGKSASGDGRPDLGSDLGNDDGIVLMTPVARGCLERARVPDLFSGHYLSSRSFSCSLG